jgi:hypothetical protein
MSYLADDIGPSVGVNALVSGLVVVGVGDVSCVAGVTDTQKERKKRKKRRKKGRKVRQLQ